MVMLSGKTILITGGTGSFGKAFVKLVLNEYSPEKIIIYSRDEFKQYEMAKKFNSDKLRFFIGDVRDPKRLHRALSCVDIVIHAAAYKHVPVCEENQDTAVFNNVYGSKNVMDISIKYGVNKGG